MFIGSGADTYEWGENWGAAPITPTDEYSGRTHGVVAADGGHIVVFRQSNPAVLIFDQAGTLLDAWGDGFNGAHGMTLIREDGAEYLWLTDTRGAMVKTTLGGERAMELAPPDLPVYRDGKFSPTWVAVNEERFGGNGDVWVTDGYGQSLIHRYDRRGDYLGTLSGEEGAAGRFKCPHGIWIDTRGAQPSLYIADRGNTRVQVYDTDGNFERAFGTDLLSSPCPFATDGRRLMIPELRARVTILDADGNLECRLGENEKVCSSEAWPNDTRALIGPGRFNSPHAMAVDTDGSLYVVEWMTGGRITKLAKC